jgi:hypothetical protein
MMRILTLCPTRGRGFKAVNETNNSHEETKALAESKLVFIVDRDDETDYTGEYDHDVFIYGRKTLPRNIMAATNEAVAFYQDRYDVIGFIGDDVRFRSKGWDEEFADALSSGGIAYGDDGVQGKSLPTHWWVTTDIIKSLGWFLNPRLRHFYMDNTWQEIGNATSSLSYRPTVNVEHLHFSFGKSEKDATYEHTMAVGSGDDIRFKEWKNSPEFQQQCETVRQTLAKRAG